MHEDSVTPWVLCKKCGSQDTRLTMSTEQTLEAAEVGALLARCWMYSVRFFPDVASYEATVSTSSGDATRSGPTQLAAIKAAVEAAEKGVRE
jgi:hypothetical protein